MKQRNRALIFGALLLCLALLLTACGGDKTQGQTGLDNANAETQEEMQARADLDSVTVEMQEETLTTDSGAEIGLSYPQISADAAANDSAAAQVVDKLNATFQQRTQAFVEQAAKQEGAHFSYSASVEYNTNGMLSVTELQSFDGPYQKYAATYDLSTGEKMTLGQVMNVDEDTAKETVAKQLDGVVQSDPNTFNSDARDYVAENVDKTMQFYRCAEGLDVFFQPGEVAPAEMGVLEIVIQ